MTANPVKLPLWLTLPLLFAFAVPALSDNTRIEVIELQGRTAEELIPLLQPVVGPEGALSGTGFELIVKATPTKLAEIKRLVGEIDHAPKRLLITVHMGELSYAEQQERSGQIRARQGDVTVEAGRPVDREGGGGIYFGDDGAVSGAARLRSTRSLGDSSDRQQVQALEGQPAYVATGTDYPYPSHLEAWRGPRGGGYGALGIDYRETATGFYALARIRGDQAYVEISPQKEGLNRNHRGAVDTQRISTTVSGPVGSWIRLGGSGREAVRQARETGRSARTRDRRDQPVWLKVEMLP